MWIQTLQCIFSKIIIRTPINESKNKIVMCLQLENSSKVTKNSLVVSVIGLYFCRVCGWWPCILNWNTKEKVIFSKYFQFLARPSLAHQFWIWPRPSLTQRPTLVWAHGQAGPWYSWPFLGPDWKFLTQTHP